MAIRNYMIENISRKGPEILSIPNPIFPNLADCNYDMDNIAEAAGEGSVLWFKVTTPKFFELSQTGVIKWIPGPFGGEKGNNGRPTIIIKASDINGSTFQECVVQGGVKGKIISSPNEKALIRNWHLSAMPHTSNPLAFIIKRSTLIT